MKRGLTVFPNICPERFPFTSNSYESEEHSWYLYCTGDLRAVAVTTGTVIGERRKI
jgi:hypothetical protein